MPELIFALDDEAFTRLAQYAAHEERTPEGQAKILLLKALDAYQEYKVKSPPVKPRPKPAAKSPVSRDGPGGMSHG